MGKKVEWKYRVRHVSDATANIDLKTSPVKHGWKRTVQRVVFENETTADTEVRIGLLDEKNQVWWWAEQETNQADVLYWTNDSLVLEARWRLFVRFTDSSSSDVLAVYAYGYEEEVQQ